MLKLPRWLRLVLLGLLALFLALVLVIALISARVSDRVIREPHYPCGLSAPFGSYEDVYQKHFIAWTPDGSQIVFSYGSKDIYIVAVAGAQLRNFVTVSPFNYPSYGIHADVSPDGMRLAYASCEFPTGSEYRYSEQERYHYEIALVNLDGTGKQRLTENRDLDYYPVWSPDGKRIAFLSTSWKRSSSVSYLPTGAGLYTMAADGSELTNAVPVPKNIALFPPVWSPDGKYLAFLVTEGQRVRFGKVLYVVRLDESELARIATSASVQPAWSPDGRFLAFVKTEEPRGIYTVRPDGTDMQKVMELNRPTIHVSWSPDGSAFLVISDEFELFVIQPDGKGVHKMSLGFEPEHTGRTIAAWSPNGSRIAYIGERPDEDSRRQKIGLYTMAADGSDVRQPAVPSSIVFALNSPVWSPEGESLMLEGYEGGTSPASYIYSVSTEGSQLSRIPVQSPEYRSFLVWSPTFDRLAAAKLEGEELALVILAADPSNPMLLTKITDRSTFERRDHPFRYGIRTILWAPDGTHILFTCESIISGST